MENFPHLGYNTDKYIFPVRNRNAGEEKSRMKQMKKWVSLVLASIMAVVLTLSFAGCGGSSAPKQEANKPVKVSLGMLRLTSSAPLFIAMDKGYFKEVGIEIDPQWFDAAQPIAVATASSKVDVGATGITAGLYNMAAKGQKLFIVADKGREQKGFSSSASWQVPPSTTRASLPLKPSKAREWASPRKVPPSITCWDGCWNPKA